MALQHTLGEARALVIGSYGNVRLHAPEREEVSDCAPTTVLELI